MAKEVASRLREKMEVERMTVPGWATSEEWEVTVGRDYLKRKGGLIDQ